MHHVAFVAPFLAETPLRFIAAVALINFGVDIDLNPVGSPRKDWQKVMVGDGLVVVRHPDHDTAWEMAERVAARLHIVAG